MDLSLLIFTLETHRFCMKCIEFTTRTYNFKNLDVGSLIWNAKTGVNSSYFPQFKFEPLSQRYARANVSVITTLQKQRPRSAPGTGTQCT